jgi:hypothetical protein
MRKAHPEKRKNRDIFRQKQAFGRGQNTTISKSHKTLRQRQEYDIFRRPHPARR